MLKVCRADSPIRRDNNTPMQELTLLLRTGKTELRPIFALLILTMRDLAWERSDFVFGSL
jgi:hypothetical protein